MKDKKFLLNERQLAQRLKDDLLGVTQQTIVPKETDMSKMELISEVEKPYVSPIFTMSEDEILAFVEEFDVRELATLSVAELNRIGEVLGVEPAILADMEEL